MVIEENKNFIFDVPVKITVKWLVKNIIYYIKNAYYKLWMNMHKVNNCKKKYNVAIVAIFKDEATYLKEWLEYHRIIGIEHFYLYNNFSKDNYKEVLKPYIEDGFVTLIEFPVEKGQLLAYKDCIDKNKEDVKWLGFIDIDEFIVPNTKDNVYDLLKKFDTKRPAVLFYWKFFGTSGLEDRNINNPVIEDFTCSFRKYSNIGKCFFNMSYDLDMNYDKNSGFHHLTWGKYKNHFLPPVNLFDKVILYDIHKVNRIQEPQNFPAQINHYYTKSFNEYLQKRKRGTVFNNIHDLDSFYWHEQKCQAIDLHIRKYIIKLKLALKDGRFIGEEIDE